MKNIEKIITDNRSGFDADHLPEGFLGRFERRLTRKKRSLSLSICSAVAAAAAVALVFLLNTPRQEQTSTAIETEIAEMKFYYENQQRMTIGIINRLLECTPDTVLVGEIRAQLKAMQRDDERFEAGISSNIDKETYIAQEVGYYRKRQESLEYIQQILQRYEN